MHRLRRGLLVIELGNAIVTSVLLARSMLTGRSLEWPIMTLAIAIYVAGLRRELRRSS